VCVVTTELASTLLHQYIVATSRLQNLL